MQINSRELLTELISMTDDAIEAAQRFKTYDLRILNFKKDAQSWSILQCLEHLNLYGDFYLPEIEKRMDNSTHRNPGTVFHSGIIGNYFANLMLGRNGKIKKMKTPKDKRPAESNLSVLTIDRFIKQLEMLKTLLAKATQVDLTKTKTSIAISNLVKLRLGDTFRFLIYHIDRHIRQADRSFEGAPKYAPKIRLGMIMF
ncbi:DinB family protein [Pollutibacter soli]|uniref:DinB family protein n=1 Tax=Pollutibacter soli TaxID=3034157 RepID=UPI00301401F2